MRKHLTIITTSLIFVVLSGLLSIAESPQQANDQGLENGFYLIRGQGSKASDFAQRTDKERVVVAPKSANTPDAVYRVRSTPDIPLELSSDPKILDSSPNQCRLAIQLVDELKPDLFRFTKDHLNDRIVIVVGNRAVMSATVRSPIADGQFEISTCYGDAGWLQRALKREPASK